MTDVQAILSRDAACIDSWLSTYFDKCEATATAPFAKGNALLCAKWWQTPAGQPCFVSS